MVKYRAYIVGVELISKVNIFKETQSYIWTTPKHREAVSGEYHRYCDTLDEAKQFVIDYHNSQITRYKDCLKRAEEDHNKALEKLKNIDL